jgi:predicted ATPase
LRFDNDDELTEILLGHKGLMKRYILTGTPGCGKTSIIRVLESAGYPVVEEAATDIIAIHQAQGITESWRDASFIDDIVNLQKQRQMQPIDPTSTVQFFDRSPVCTYALSRWLGFPISATLADEMERIRAGRIYETQVFFIENLGHCEPTAARRISFEDSLRFEKVHEETYREFGYECVKIPAGAVSGRAEQVKSYVASLVVNTHIQKLRSK